MKLFFLFAVLTLGSISLKGQSGIFQYNGMADVRFSFPERGVGGRAIVHDVGNSLTFNYAGDFTGGTRLGPNFFVGVNGTVGIGTQTPTESLDVRGKTRTETALVTNNNGRMSEILPGGINAGASIPDRSQRTIHYEIYSPWDAAQIQLRAGSTTGVQSKIRLQANWSGTRIDGQGGVYFAPDGNDRHVMLHNGNVGIGTITPAEKLSVNGKIRAYEIKVEVTGWPDYVFEPNYRLQSLSELDQFIKIHGHLPDMPSASEAESEGISLGEFNTLLLKRMEEQTLHLIEKDKEISELRDEVAAIKDLLKKLL